MNGYERILTLIDGGTPDRLPFMPITMMFAADQLGISYREYVSDYRKLVEAQILTARKIGADQVSVISDPGREAADFGADVVFYEDQPPAINEANALLADKKRLDSITVLDPRRPAGRMNDRVCAVSEFRRQVQGKYLIEGWVEGPCAEGADLRGINQLMLDFIEDPDFVGRLFEKSVANAIRFAEAQIEEGADIVGVGDAAASLVGPKRYRELVFPFEQRLVQEIQRRKGRVRLHICGNISRSLPEIGRLGCELVDLDSMVSVEAARAQTSPRQILTGNINPVLILKNSTPETIVAELQKCYEAARSNYIVGAGCEVPRNTPLENVLAMRRFAESRPGVFSESVRR